jgi:hypothetical protein
MGDRPRSFLGCARVRTKCTQKTRVGLWGRYMMLESYQKLVPLVQGSDGVLQVVSEPTLEVSGRVGGGSGCRCFGSDRTPGVAPQGVFRSRTASTTLAKWFVPIARGTVDMVYRFGPLRDA